MSSQFIDYLEKKYLGVGGLKATCEVCKKQVELKHPTNARGRMIRHAVSHLSPFFRCPVTSCGQLCRRPDNGRQHIKEKHPNETREPILTVSEDELKSLTREAAARCFQTYRAFRTQRDARRSRSSSLSAASSSTGKRCPSPESPENLDSPFSIGQLMESGSDCGRVSECSGSIQNASLFERCESGAWLEEEVQKHENLGIKREPSSSSRRIASTIEGHSVQRESSNGGQEVQAVQLAYDNDFETITSYGAVIAVSAMQKNKKGFVM